MTTNVFGPPVLGGTREARATEAYNNQNASGKLDQAKAYVRKEKENYGNGVSTLSIFYNATGEAITYVQDHNWWGAAYDPYPVKLQNGQWGAFLHTKQAYLPSGSNAAVLYNGKCYPTTTESCDMLFAWSTPWNQAKYDNISYCEIGDGGYTIDWDKIYEIFDTNSGSAQDSATGKGLLMSTYIEKGTSPLYKAILTLDNIEEAKADAAATAATRGVINSGEIGKIAEAKLFFADITEANVEAAAKEDDVALKGLGIA